MSGILGMSSQSLAKGLERVTSLPGTQKAIERDADKLIEKARRIYLRQAKHPNTVAPYYVESFKKVPQRFRKLKGWRVSNTDPTWIWIEFGAHPHGGDTMVLKYRPMGRAIDEMAGGLNG